MTEEPVAAADRILEMVGDRAEAAVTVTRGSTALTRFANSRIHQNVAEDAETITIRCVVNGRAATGTANQSDDETLRRLVDRVIDAASVRPPDPDWPGLAPPVPVSTVEHHDDATETAPPAARAEAVRAFVEAGADTEAAGFCSTTGMVTGFANSLGHRVQRRESAATIDGIHRTARGFDGGSHQSSFRLADLEGSVAGREAAQRAASAADPIDLDPGRYEVVLQPACVADMLTFLSWYGFNGKAFAEGTSFVHPGEQQFDRTISLYDDATAPGTLGVVFDAEGTPKHRVDLVAAGVTQAVVHDRRSGAKAGVDSTGHAATFEVIGPYPQNLFLAAGEGGSVDDLVRSVERGLLVCDFWYTRILDPKTQVVTGLTRNGLFLIEGGEVTRPVKNLRFTQSYVGALAPGKVLGVGSAPVLIGLVGLGALSNVPPLRLAEWSFTGGAKG